MTVVAQLSYCGIFVVVAYAAFLSSYRALQGGLLVAPILQKLLFNREPQLVLDWVNKISRWNFKRIIPCHLANNIQATPREFREAFSFLEEPSTTDAARSNDVKTNSFVRSLLSILGLTPITRLPRPLDRDLTLLSDASTLLTKQGVVKPEAPKLPKQRRAPSAAAIITK